MPPPTPDNLSTLSVPPEAAGVRLDRWLARSMPAFSRSRLQGLIAAGDVRLDGNVVSDCGHRLKPGQRIDLVVPPPVAAEPVAISAAGAAATTGSVAAASVLRSAESNSDVEPVKPSSQQPALPPLAKVLTGAPVGSIPDIISRRYAEALTGKLATAVVEAAKAKIRSTNFNLQ